MHRNTPNDRSLVRGVYFSQGHSEAKLFDWSTILSHLRVVSVILESRGYAAFVSVVPFGGVLG